MSEKGTPRTMSFAGCTTDEQALARLEGFLDELDESNLRRYAEDLFKREPDIDQAEFQTCLTQYRAFLKGWRDEHREEMDATFQRVLDAARRASRAVR